MIGSIIYNIEENVEVKTSPVCISRENLSSLPEAVSSRSLIIVNESGLGYLVDLLKAQKVGVLGPGRDLDMFQSDREFREVICEGCGIAVYEKQMDVVPLGADCFFDGRSFVKEHTIVVRMNENVRISKWLLSSVITETMEKITPYLQDENFRGKITFDGYWDGSRFLLDEVNFLVKFPECVNIPACISNSSQFLGSLIQEYVTEPRVRAQYVAECYLAEKQEYRVAVNGTWVGAFEEVMKSSGMLINKSVGKELEERLELMEKLKIVF